MESQVRVLPSRYAPVTELAYVLESESRFCRYPSGSRFASTNPVRGTKLSWRNGRRTLTEDLVFCRFKSCREYQNIWVGRGSFGNSRSQVPYGKPLGRLESLPLRLCPCSPTEEALRLERRGCWFKSSQGYW